MHNENLLGLLTAPMPVGSGDLLGIVDTDLIIRLSLIGSAFVIELAVLAMLINVIAQIRREKKQDRSESNNRPSQRDELVCLPLNLGGGTQLILGNKNLKPSSSERQKRHGGIGLPNGSALGLGVKLFKFLNNVVGFLRHKNRTMPNVES
jgi:hypothetical protein